MSDTILRLPKVKERTGLSRSGIYERIKTGGFPRPVRLGLRAVGWIEEEVDAWVQGRIKESRTRTRKAGQK
ncbi:MAG: AlpA family transcriptional regulator [Candidatus Omnitrophica bacterium]|nr:AlpA family transcriptional regulator [Candidatus Omnitrophota bacterium]